MPIQNLHGFLSEVSRVLAPGGVFLFREHDASVYDTDSEEPFTFNGKAFAPGEAPYPMLDL